jgi:hypothetical protein
MPDHAIADALRERGDRGTPRGNEDVFRRARALADAPSPRDALTTVPDQTRPQSRAALRIVAVITLAAAVVGGAIYLRSPRTTPDHVTTPGTATPTEPTLITPSPTLAAGCPISQDCPLPEAPVSFDVPGLPPGWQQDGDPTRGLVSNNATSLYGWFRAPVPDVAVPGGPAPRRIQIRLHIDRRITEGLRAAWAERPGQPLGHGRTLYTLTSSTPPVATPDPSLTLNTAGADLGGDLSLEATGSGVPADVLAAAVQSIVVR